MNKSNLRTLLLGSLGMLVIILDGKTAISGMRKGLDLCLNTLVPSLFPFFVLSTLVTSSLMGTSVKAAGFLSKFCRMPAGSESLLFVGLLGGYPLGAGNIALEYKRGTISKADAERMAIFCNNAGPSFLFGILGPMFTNIRLVWLLWSIQITATLLTGFLLPGSTSVSLRPTESDCISVSDALSRSIRNMALVSSWVVLFRVILEFFQTYIPYQIPILLTGLLELSNGCYLLSHIQSQWLRFFVAGIMLSLGGICVWMQTKSVFPELNLLRYITGRLLHCLICMAISLMTVLLMGNNSTFNIQALIIIICFALISVVLFLRKPKKEVAFYG